MSVLGKPAHPSVHPAQKASCIVGGARRETLVGHSAVSPMWVPVEDEEVKKWMGDHKILKEHKVGAFPFMNAQRAFQNVCLNLRTALNGIGKEC